MEDAAGPTMLGNNAPLPGRLRSCLDSVRHNRIKGWAWDEARPHLPVTLTIRDNGIVIGQVQADQYRPDLLKLGIGNGQHGFSFVIKGGLSQLTSHVIGVERHGDGKALRRSPWLLEAATVLDPGSTPETAEASQATAYVAEQARPSDPNKLSSSWRGHLDRVTRDRIVGWACDESFPDKPVVILVLNKEVFLCRVLANRYRKDLESEGIGNGRHGFEVIIPGGLSPIEKHVISVRREVDGGELRKSPRVIEAADSFDVALEHHIARAIDGLTYSAEQERVTSFMVGQVERLQQQRAAAEGQQTERRIFRQFRRRFGGSFNGAPYSVDDPGHRALVVDDNVPVGNRDAGSQAILSHMRALQNLGYDVSFVAAREMPQDGVDVSVLDAHGIGCWQSPYYGSVEEVLRRQASCFDLVYLHRASNASKYMALVRHYCPKARVLYGVADLHHVRLERQAQVEDRPELLARSRQQRLIECTAAWSADAVLTHSTAEAILLRKAVPDAKVHVVPWSVPVSRSVAPSSSRNGVAFIGGYAHTPNVDAVRFLVGDIMPQVWRMASSTSIECLLVGSAMPQAVRRLERTGVIIVGEVDDLSQVFTRVKLTVAPLRYGAGVKGKVLASLAAGIPCVMSPIAAEGLALPPLLQKLIGSDETEMAKLIYRVHEDADLQLAASEAGLAFIEANFSEAKVAEALRAAVQQRRPVIGVGASIEG